ncbi:MAG TPA: DUF6580 family putative transport protein [Candidatus Angelobacter sp.]|nr:DUF6580 family putative transport protein [Candidatus Angelobacter sp.]
MLAYLLVLMAIAVRLFSGLGSIGTMGFSPLDAALLFFGSRMPRKHFLAVLALLIGTDIYLTTQRYGMAVTWDQSIIGAFYLGVFFLGSFLKSRVKPLYVGAAALTSAVSFFIVSNFGVWLAGMLYPRTWAGFTACYVAAIPFFKTGLVSDLVFSAVFFSLPVFYARLSGSTASSKAAA